MTLEDEMRELKATVAALTARMGQLEDVNAIRGLHHKYGYYMDKFMFGAIVDLFAEDCTLYFMGGIFRGKAGARRLYGGASGLNGPIRGIMYDHYQMQDIIDVAPDRKTAKGRFRCLLLAGVHESKKDAPPRMPKQFFDSGLYENEFVREDGIWKIKVFNYHLIWQANFETGWAHSPPKPLTAAFHTTTYPENPRGPDELAPAPPLYWPENFVVPFHYPHPVTGTEWTPG